VERYTFLILAEGLMSLGLTAQTVKGDKIVRVPGLTSSAVSVMVLRPRGFNFICYFPISLFSLMKNSFIVNNRAGKLLVMGKEVPHFIN